MSGYQCQHCSESLSFIEHTRSPFCEKPSCQRAKVQLYLVENKRRLTAQLISECKEYTNQLPVQKLPSQLRKKLKESLPVVALLPANTNQLTNLKQQRKLEFLQHLSAIFNDVEKNNPTANKVYSKQLNEPLPQEESQLFGNACATCKGSCCKLGQTHAFIDYPSLKHWLASQATTLSEQELLDLYSDYFPKQSYQNACVFLGNMGCTLPREMRSFTCNNYLCESLLSYRQNFKQADSTITFAAAVENDKIMFTSVYSHKDFIRVKEK